MSVGIASNSKVISEGLPTLQGRGLVAWLALAAVALAILSSGIVFSEPAPVDVLTMGLMVLLPTVGLFTINRTILVYAALWLTSGACAMLAATLSFDVGETTQHVAVTLYLYASTILFAGFVANSPRAHTELILKAWTVAALIAAGAGLIGYFGLLPGAYDLFTENSRATGTFKDPNVFGPFLVVPVLYLLSSALQRSVTGMLMPLALAGILMLAVFLSFSRGAWANLALALAIFGYLTLVTTSRAIVRLKIVALLAMGCIVGVGVVLAALTSDNVSDLLAQRATLSQSYDVGSQGRFGGQEKAIELIAQNPLGIGAQQFAARYHPEEVHNVYLTLMLSAGWLGGGIYWILYALTIVLGFRHAMKATENRLLFIAVYAAFVATALESMIIDSNHWRHIYVMMAILWGLMSADRRVGDEPPARRSPHLIRPVSMPGPRRRISIVGPAAQPA
jgi:O-antigen ligase